jgi:hypothetical protein
MLSGRFRRSVTRPSRRGVFLSAFIGCLVAAVTASVLAEAGPAARQPRPDHLARGGRTLVWLRHHYSVLARTHEKRGVIRGVLVPATMPAHMVSSLVPPPGSNLQFLLSDAQYAGTLPGTSDQIWVFPTASGLICHAVYEPQSGAINVGCASAATAGASAGGFASLDYMVGVVPNGVEQVTVAMQDGSLQSASVANNVWSIAGPFGSLAGARSVKLQDASGATNVIPLH